MIRILHYYPQSSDDIIAQHIDILCRSIGLGAQCDIASTPADVRQRLAIRHCYDVLHIHGCWHNSMRWVIRQAQRQGIRLVVTPLGQLEPWIVQQHYWKEKLPKLVAYQRDLICSSFAIIVQGRMERECIEQLGWNRRLVIIRNSLITSTITPQQMATATYRLYCNVMDTDPLALMNTDARQLLHQGLKAGITGDRRWLPSPLTSPTLLAEEQWRALLAYIRQEQVADVVERGLRLLGIDVPDISLDRSEPFMPDDYEPIVSIDSVIGQQFATENDRLMATFRHLRRLVLRRRLALAHLVELDRELRQHPCDEEQLAESLRERHLYKMACRIMQLMADLTGLDEGFMPVPPLADRLTRRLRQQVEHLLNI